MADNLPKIPYTLQNIRDLKFYSVYNLQPLQSYSLRDFNSGDTKHRIYQNYINAYEADFTSRAGMNAEEFSKKAGLHSKLVTENTDFIKNFKIAQNNFSINNTELNKYVNDLLSGDSDRLQKLAGKEKEIIKVLENWANSVQEYLDVLSRVDDLYYFRNMDQAQINGSISMASGRNISQAFRLERSAMTAMQNADALIVGLKQSIDKVNQEGLSVKQLSNMVITTPSYEGVRGQAPSTTKTLGNLKTMVGSLSNLMGFAFEAQLASGLERQVNEALSDIALLGGAEGVSVTLSDGRPFKVKQSKTDLRATVEGVDLGFSLKNLSKNGKTKRVSLNTSNTNQLIALISNNQDFRSQLAGTLMWRSNSIKRTSDQLTMFLASLSADYAIAMGGNDRIDYMVFNDKVISLGEYYSIMEKRLSLKIHPSASQSSYQNQLRELREREILANMPVKFTT